MLNKVRAWFEAQGGLAHVVAATWLAAIGAYMSVPPFHALVIDMWAKTPPDVRSAGLAAAGLLSWYSSTRKAQAAQEQGRADAAAVAAVPIPPHDFSDQTKDVPLKDGH